VKLLVYAAFFATSVYGHVALKLAVDRSDGMVRAMLSGWGLSALAAWTLSALVWMKVLEGDTLFAANTISALRYAFVALAALLVFEEALDARGIVGSLLVGAGVWLVAVR
jgi:uncharacterized membrane protein